MGEEDKGISQRVNEALLKHLREYHGAKAVKDWMLESGLGALSEHNNTHHNPDYAEVDLSNLIATAINQDLLPTTDSSKDLGSSSKFWRALFLDRLIVQKSTLTIDANDEITVPLTTWVYLTSAGATDNLDGIGAGVEGQIAFLTPTAGKDITLVHNGTVTTGKKLMINGEANVTLDQDHDLAIAIYDATATVWVVLVPGSGGGGGATTALDNLASVAVNTDLISDTNLTDDLGSSSIYWNKAYVKEVNLNSGAKIDGATANKAKITAADISLMDASNSAKVGIGSGGQTGTMLLLQPTSPPSTTLFRGLRGSPYITYPSGGSTGHVRGLDYQPAVGVGGGGAVMPEVTAVYAKPHAVFFTGTVTAMYGMHVPALLPFGGTPSIATYSAFYSAASASNKLVDALGLEIDDFTNNTGFTRLLNLGPSTPYMRLVGGGDGGARQTNLYLKEQATLRRLQTKDGASIGAGDRVAVLV